MCDSLPSVNRPSDQFEPFIPSQHQRAVPQANHVSRHQPPEPARPGGVHEVLLEPADECCSFHRESAAGAALEMDTRASLPSNLAAAPSALPQLDRPSASAPVSRAPSRAASALPAGACARNGLVSTPSPILEPNGIDRGGHVPEGGDHGDHAPRQPAPAGAEEEHPGGGGAVGQGAEGGAQRVGPCHMMMMMLMDE